MVRVLCIREEGAGWGAQKREACVGRGRSPEVLSKVDHRTHPNIHTQPRPECENASLMSDGQRLLGPASLPWLCDLVKDP